MAHTRPKNLLSKREEERLVEAGQRILLDGGYPNPDRVGCPGPEVLKGLATRKMDLRMGREWVLHIGSCSPCFVEYAAFKKQEEKHKTLELVLAAAVLVIVVVGGIWLWKVYQSYGTGGKPNVPTVLAYQKVTVDLRNWFVPRGEQHPNANSGPVQLPRGRLGLTILLPVGSQPGNYEILVGSELGKSRAIAKGTAVIRNDGVTVLKVELDASKLNPGGYVLTIGRSGAEGTEYPLVVK